MSEIDTSKEAVERLADRCEATGMASGAAAAATLRALAGERDALRLREAEAVVATNNAHRERMQAEREARAAEADRDAARAEVARLKADAMRYRYLREHCSDHYPMTHEQPAEWSIQWGFQQVNPTQAYGTFDGWIDADIARLDDEDRAALAGDPQP